MKNKRPIVLSVLCIALFLATAVMTSFHVLAAENYLGNGSDWCAALFGASSEKYNNELALVAAEMSDKSEQGEDTIKQLYHSYGLYACEYHNFGFNKSAAFAIGQDTLTIGGIDTTILVVTARGSTTWWEYAGDLFHGVGVDFIDTRVWGNVHEFEETIWKGINDYVNDYPVLKSKKNLKILVTGHSLGGAAANIIGARFTNGLVKEDWCYGKIEKKDIYVYTFGAIKTLIQEKNISAGYENIHNIYNHFDSFGPNGNFSYTNASSPYAKFGHTEIYNLYDKETGAVLMVDSCNNHMNYIEAIKNTKKSGLDTCPAAMEIEMDASVKILEEGNKVTLKAAATQKSLQEKSIIWGSSNTAVASVTQKGVVTAKKKGTAQITATIQGTRYKATCCIDVKKKAGAETKSDLLEKIRLQTNEPIIKAFYADYDGDGVKELFAAVGKGYYEGCAKEIWFAGSKEIKRLHESSGGDIYEINGSPGKVCTVSKKQKFFISESGGYGSGSTSECWYVKSGRVQNVNMDGLGGLSQISGCDFTVVPNGVFDASCSSDGAWTGHTYKPYYVRWTGRKFEEYKAKKISTNKLRQYKGADIVLKKIRQAGYWITTIYYRSNGLIHINAEKTNTEYGERSCDNITLKIRRNRVSVLAAYDSTEKESDIIKRSSYGGIYKASFKDE